MNPKVSTWVISAERDTISATEDVISAALWRQGTLTRRPSLSAASTRQCFEFVRALEEKQKHLVNTTICLGQLIDMHLKSPLPIIFEHLLSNQSIFSSKQVLVNSSGGIAFAPNKQQAHIVQTGVLPNCNKNCPPPHVRCTESRDFQSTHSGWCYYSLLHNGYSLCLSHN